MELDVDASQAGLDPAGLPLDEGVEDVLALGVVKLEVACWEMKLRVCKTLTRISFLGSSGNWCSSWRRAWA